MPTPLRTSLLRKEGRREGLDSSIAPVAPHARSRALHSDCVLFYAAARPCSSEYPTGRFPFGLFCIVVAFINQSGASAGPPISIEMHSQVQGSNPRGRRCVKQKID